MENFLKKWSRTERNPKPPDFYVESRTKQNPNPKPNLEPEPNSSEPEPWTLNLEHMGSDHHPCLMAYTLKYLLFRSLHHKLTRIALLRRRSLLACKYRHIIEESNFVHKLLYCHPSLENHLDLGSNPFFESLEVVYYLKKSYKAASVKLVNDVPNLTCTIFNCIPIIRILPNLNIACFTCTSSSEYFNFIFSTTFFRSITGAINYFTCIIIFPESRR